MQIIIKGKQMQVAPQLKQRIERKVQRLTRLAGEEARIEVTVTEEQTKSAQDRFSVQLAISGNSHPIHSEVSALNAATALDLVIDKVMAQLGKQKGRLTTARRHHASPVKVLALSREGQLTLIEEEAEDDEIDEFVAGEVEDTHNEEIWARVMEIRRLPARPMTDQEVIEEMQRSGVNYYPFYNGETGSVNVMYRLDDGGGYGLLVPAVETAE